jgi:hypothetical protein
MLAALKYKQNILDNFYLDEDDITIKRKVDDIVKGKFKKDDVVIPYTLRGNRGHDYKGIHIPGCKTTISLPWVLSILREIDFEDGCVIDHIDGDITNNSRDNIRITTQEMNCKNRKKRYDNTSGYTGLSFHKPTGRWAVRRTIKGKRLWRSHKTFDGAVRIWKEMEKLGLQDGYTERHGY